MKAKQTSVRKNEKSESKSKSLVSHSELTEKFGNYSDFIENWNKESMSVSIDGDDSLYSAENNLSTVHQTLQNIEKVRKELKEPYFKTGKAIDNYAKTLMEPLERIKQRFNNAIASYKEVQAAKARADAEEERKKLEEAAKEADIESERINRIFTQVIARTFGGSFINKESERISYTSCNTVEDCEKLSELIITKLPPYDSFIHMQTSYSDTVVLIGKMINKHKLNLIKKNSAKTQEDIQEAEKEISETRIKYTDMADDSFREMQHIKEKIIQKEEKNIEKTIKESAKNTRKYIKFTIYNEKEVPIDFKSVDERLVRQYIDNHKEEVFKKMQNNEDIINGIKFYVETKNIVR